MILWHAGCRAEGKSQDSFFLHFQGAFQFVSKAAKPDSVSGLRVVTGNPCMFEFSRFWNGCWRRYKSEWPVEFESRFGMTARDVVRLRCLPSSKSHVPAMVLGSHPECVEPSAFKRLSRGVERWERAQVRLRAPCSRQSLLYVRMSSPRHPRS